MMLVFAAWDDVSVLGTHLPLFPSCDIRSIYLIQQTEQIEHLSGQVFPK